MRIMPIHDQEEPLSQELEELEDPHLDCHGHPPLLYANQSHMDFCVFPCVTFFPH